MSLGLRPPPRAAILALIAFAAVAALTIHNLQSALPVGAGLLAAFLPSRDSTAELLVNQTLLSRVAVALMAGYALALSGTILQHVLRNPLAEPATLGISAGASLAMTIAGVFAPGLLLFSPDIVALSGAILAMAAVLALAARHALSPVTVALAGLIVSLYAGAAGAVITLFNHELLIGIFLWGAGYLDQQGWDTAVFLAPALAVLIIAAGLLIRPLGLLGLDEAGARALGLNVPLTRLALLGIAAALAALVTSRLGIISFIGLAAPAIARAIGARRIGAQLVVAGLSGALLLLAADQLVLALPVTYRLFPTGALTAVIGAPMLLFLLPKLRTTVAAEAANVAPSRNMRHPGAALVILLSFAAALFIASLTIGRGPDGWSIPGLTIAWDILDLRLPRTLAAFAGGALLALSGVLLQRLTGNPLASPEVLGVSSGAMLGTIAVMLGMTAATRGDLIAGGVGGAVLALLLLIGLSWKSAHSPARMVLAGIALGSVSNLVIAVLMASQDPRLERVMAWLSGSTYAVATEEGMVALVVLVSGVVFALLLRHWLTILPLGATAATGLGISPSVSRTLLLLIAALAAATATILVGPLSFAGLMGPHLARMAGFRRAGPQILAAGLIGGAILITADWAGRIMIFPFQIPAGLLATMIGGPFLLYLIGRR